MKGAPFKLFQASAAYLNQLKKKKERRWDCLLQQILWNCSNTLCNLRLRTALHSNQDHKISQKKKHPIVCRAGWRQKSIKMVHFSPCLEQSSPCSQKNQERLCSKWPRGKWKRGKRWTLLRDLIVLLPLSLSRIPSPAFWCCWTSLGLSQNWLVWFFSKPEITTLPHQSAFHVFLDFSVENPWFLQRSWPEKAE